jgi:hypothetical protein
MIVAYFILIGYDLRQIEAAGRFFKRATQLERFNRL